MFKQCPINVKKWVVEVEKVCTFHMISRVHIVSRLWRQHLLQ
jgi:hypothetical protein